MFSITQKEQLDHFHAIALSNTSEAATITDATTALRLYLASLFDHTEPEFWRTRDQNCINSPKKTSQNILSDAFRTFEPSWFSRRQQTTQTDTATLATAVNMLTPYRPSSTDQLVYNAAGLLNGYAQTKAPGKIIPYNTTTMAAAYLIVKTLRQTGNAETCLGWVNCQADLQRLLTDLRNIPKPDAFCKVLIEKTKSHLLPIQLAIDAGEHRQVFFNLLQQQLAKQVPHSHKAYPCPDSLRIYPLDFSLPYHLMLLFLANKPVFFELIKTSITCFSEQYPKACLVEQSHTLEGLLPKLDNLETATAAQAAPTGRPVQPFQGFVPPSVVTSASHLPAHQATPSASAAQPLVYPTMIRATPVPSYNTATENDQQVPPPYTPNP